MVEPKRKLNISFMDLESAFDNHDEILETTYYLDLETGEVVMNTGEDRRRLEDVYQNYANPETGEVDWNTVLPQLGIQDWEQDQLILTDQIEAGFGDRYISIPGEDSSEGYNDMTWFIDTVSDQRLRSRLERAIIGRGAFRRFKDVLFDYPKEREQWFQFEDERKHKRIEDWLDFMGIEADRSEKDI